MREPRPETNKAPKGIFSKMGFPEKKTDSSAEVHIRGVVLAK